MKATSENLKNYSLTVQNKTPMIVSGGECDEKKI
jgi:hypothetical protein